MADVIADEDKLSFSGTLGEGGNAVVRLARQVSLQRDVAVKTTKAGRPPGAVDELVREARVIGALAHPNVIPVHLLARTETDEPLVVMKRVEGTPWISYVGTGGQLHAPDDTDPLEWHVRVLMVVCNVAHFAHQRGILHRDLKLRNVMIGELGEVYVLDWGLAAKFDPACPLDLPRAWKTNEVVGTPGYMAPEMALVESDRVGPRTDVYLLGACLHVVLTGTARHLGGDVMTRLLMAAHSGPWPYDIDGENAIPPELAQIANRACHRDPEARFDSAEAMRDALDAYLRHRDSNRLADAASRSLPELRQLTVATTGDDDEARNRQLASLLAECRFGFQQALVTWPENPRALEGLREVRTHQVTEALTSGHIERAERLLGDMEDAPPDLFERLEALRRARAERVDEIEKLRAIGREVDQVAGVGFRAAISAFIATVWTVIFMTLSYLKQTGVIGDLPVLVGSLIGLHAVTITILSIRFWSVWDSTSVNRRFLWALMFSALAAAALYAGSRVMGLSTGYGIALVEFSFAAACAVAAVAIDLRLIASAVVFAIGFMVTLFYPDPHWFILGMSTLIAVGWLAIVWGRDWRRLRRG